MKVYRHSDPMAEVSRARHWTTSEHDESHRYYNFRESPELITEVLEDFRPHQNQPAIREFYRLLGNINGESSSFETNDCAFKPPHDNTSRGVSLRQMQISGRLMFFFREVALNTNRSYIEWLEDGVHFYLSQLTPELEEGVVGTSVMRSICRNSDRNGHLQKDSSYAFTSGRGAILPRRLGPISTSSCITSTSRLQSFREMPPRSGT